MTGIPPLEALREVAPPPVAAVRARARGNARRRRRMAATAGVAAVFAVAVVAREAGVGSGDTARDRGVGAAPLVALEAVAEGSGPPRALSPGAEVAPTERVVFLVRADRPAFAVLREQDRVVWPASGEWRVDGESPVGADAPLSWRPDGRDGPLRYDLLACTDPRALATGGPGCATASLLLRWAP